MSNYCKWCQYSVKEKTCPMTHLYWDFVDRNHEIFSRGRTPYILSTLAKVDIEKVRKAKAVFTTKLT
jgi:deoxyribodipyrimidine photolyase-related protein